MHSKQNAIAQSQMYGYIGSGTSAREVQRDASKQKKGNISELSEQIDLREKEEEQLRHKVMTLKALEQKIKEQAEQRDRIAGMKQRESGLQKQLIEKIQKDR